MNKPLPKVVCSDCFKSQTFTGQHFCKSCDRPLRALAPWSDQAQYAPQKEPRRQYVLAPSPDTGRPEVSEKQADQELVGVRVLRKARTKSPASY